MSDARPANCRFRLQDEGKSYPRSSCTACGRTVGTGLGTACATWKADYEKTSGDEEEKSCAQWKDARTHREPIWPLMGYAPGGYSFRCVECNETFLGGDKRATNCLPCAIDRANARAKQVAIELQFMRSQVATLRSAIKIIRDVEVE